MILKPLNPHSPAARRLLDLSDRYLAERYPAESNHLETPDMLQQPNVHFMGGYIGEELIACGAIKRQTDEEQPYGELKRIFVLPEQRGNGYAGSIIRHLEYILCEHRIKIVRLETGVHQPEAYRLYSRLGYRTRGPFGHYTSDPYSIFMEKTLRLP